MSDTLWPSRYTAALRCISSQSIRDKRPPPYPTTVRWISAVPNRRVSRLRCEICCGRLKTIFASRFARARPFRFVLGSPCDDAHASRRILPSFMFFVWRVKLVQFLFCFRILILLIHELARSSARISRISPCHCRSQSLWLKRGAATRRWACARLPVFAACSDWMRGTLRLRHCFRR